MRGFAGVNNHNVALYMIRSWDLHLLDLQEQKQVAVFFTHVSHLMVVIQGNSGRNMIRELFKCFNKNSSA